MKRNLKYQKKSTFFIGGNIYYRAVVTRTNHVRSKHPEVIFCPRKQIFDRNSCGVDHTIILWECSLTYGISESLLIFSNLHCVVLNGTVSIETSCPGDIHFPWSSRDHFDILWWVWYICRTQKKNKTKQKRNKNRNKKNKKWELPLMIAKRLH